MSDEKNIPNNTIAPANAKAKKIVAYLSLDELTAALVRKAKSSGQKQVTTMRVRNGSGHKAFSIDDIVTKSTDTAQEELFDIIAGCNGAESYITVTNGDIDKWLAAKNPENGYPLTDKQIAEITANYKNSQAAFNHTNLAIKKANPELWKEKQAEAKETLAALGL